MVGRILICILLAGTVIWVVSGRPRPNISTVHVVVPTVTVAHPVTTVLTFVQVALEHRGGIPTEVTVNAQTVPVIMNSRGVVHLCWRGQCALVNTLTRHISLYKQAVS